MPVRTSSVDRRGISAQVPVSDIRSGFFSARGASPRESAGLSQLMGLTRTPPSANKISRAIFSGSVSGSSIAVSKAGAPDDRPSAELSNNEIDELRAELRARRQQVDRASAERDQLACILDGLAERFEQEEGSKHVCQRMAPRPTLSAVPPSQTGSMGSSVLLATPSAMMVPGALLQSPRPGAQSPVATPGTPSLGRAAVRQMPPASPMGACRAVATPLLLSSGTSITLTGASGTAQAAVPQPHSCGPSISEPVVSGTGSASGLSVSTSVSSSTGTWRLCQSPPAQAGKASIRQAVGSIVPASPVHPMASVTWSPLLTAQASPVRNCSPSRLATDPGRVF